MLAVVFLLLSSMGVWAVGLSQTLDAVVAIAPAELTVDPGATFTVEVVIQDVSDLGGYEFRVAYDPNVVAVRGVESGGFLEESGRTLIPLGPDIDNEAGTVDYAMASFGDAPGAEGSGTLAVITLEAMAEGVSELEMVGSELQVFGPSGTEMRVGPQSGRVQVGAGATPTATPGEATTEPTEAATTTPSEPTATPGGSTMEPTTAPTATPGGGATEPTAAPTTLTTTPSEPTATPVEGATEPTMAPTVTPSEPMATTEPLASPTVMLGDSTGETTVAATATSPPPEAEEGEGGAEPTATDELPFSEGDQTPGPGRRWLILGAVLLAAAGAVFIAGGIYLFGPDKGTETALDDEGEEG